MVISKSNDALDACLNLPSDPSSATAHRGKTKMLACEPLVDKAVEQITKSVVWKG